MNVVPDDPWTGSHDALLCLGSITAQLAQILRRGLRDAYISVLSDEIPEELERQLARLDQTATGQVSVGESGVIRSASSACDRDVILQGPQEPELLG